MSKKFTLIPVMMRRPNKDFVSTPSKQMPHIEVTQNEFNAKYAGTEHMRTISLEPDGVSKPHHSLTAVGRGIPYIRADSIE